MTDKSAITTTAQKFLAKGQIDMAIAEMKKLIGDGTDGNLHNLIGDLYFRKNATQEAIEYFAKAADIFRKDGFNLKAIALYKKILNISSTEVYALIALAELNEEKGLIGNAIENYFTVADIHIKNKSTEKAFDIYQKVIKLSPENINLKHRIAGLYEKLGLSGETVKLYIEIASDYSEKGETEKAKGFYQKIIGIDSKNLASLIGLSRVAEQENDIGQAVEFIEKALSFSPDDKELLLQRTQLALISGDTDEAKGMLSRILGVDPSNASAKKLLGDIYIKENALDKAWEVLMPYVDDAIMSGNWDDALEFLDTFKELDPVAVRIRLASISKSRGNTVEAVKELKELAGLYEDREQHNSALQSYRDILGFEPGDVEVKARVKELEKQLGISSAPGPDKNIVIDIASIETGEDETDVEMVMTPPAPGPDKNIVIDIASIETGEDEADVEMVMTPPALEADETVPSEVVAMSSEEFDEKKTEADFYSQYGFKDQAFKLYERLLAASPGNREIEEKLKAISSIEEPAAAVAPVEEETHDDANMLTDNDVKDIFKEFQKGLEKEVGEKDSETHYNLGIAYKEMGLIEDAIKELEISAKDPKKHLLSIGVIALCYMSQGLYPAAIREYKRAIESISSDNDSYLGLNYDLADAYSKNKDYRNALKILIEIHEMSPDFRNVKQKMEKIKGIISGDNGNQKKDRVSYI